MSDEEPQYDLEERTFQFALAIRRFISGNTWSQHQKSDLNQVLRSSGSVAANYIEANNAVSKADFLLRIRISKKEASESRLWLRLLAETSANPDLIQSLRNLYKEADELSRILATILRNSQ